MIEIYTDGGCRPNPGNGGWAAIIYYGYVPVPIELSGYVEGTTNNRMEIQAVIEALTYIGNDSNAKIVITTDSQYVKNGITSWIHSWKKNHWRNSAGEVANKDLWQRLDALVQGKDITWKWIRGHCDNPHNDRCDELCTMEILKDRS